MAVAFTQLSAISGSTSNVTSYPGTPGTPAANELLMCFVSASGTVAAGTMTGGGLTWNKLTSFTKNSGADTIYVFWAAATGATSTTPTFDCTGDGATGAIIHCIRITGSEGISVPSIKQYKTNTASTANPSVTMDKAITTTNGVIGFVANGTNSSTQFTAPGSWTELGEGTYNTPANAAETASRATGETGTTITWTNANTTPWGAIVIEFWVPRNRSLGGGISISGPLSF